MAFPARAVSIGVSPDAIRFLGEREVAQITIVNPNEDIVECALEQNESWFEISDADVSIGPGKTARINVTPKPGITEGSYAARILVLTRFPSRQGLAILPSAAVLISAEILGQTRGGRDGKKITSRSYQVKEITRPDRHSFGSRETSSYILLAVLVCAGCFMYWRKSSQISGNG